MKQKLSIILLLSWLFVLPNCANKESKQQAKNEQTSPKNKMQWWKNAKFGLFIHWGVYSVPAGVYNDVKIKGNGEWIMNIAKIPVADYKEIAKHAKIQF